MGEQAAMLLGASNMDNLADRQRRQVSPWRRIGGGVTLHAILIYFLYAAVQTDTAASANGYARASVFPCAAHRKKLKIKLSHSTERSAKLGI